METKSGYARLGPRCVRVLELEEATCSSIRAKSRSGVIHGRFRTVHLDHPTSYHALSYVWGTWHPPRTIFVHDDDGNFCKVNVTQNCYTALLYLRDHFNVRRIWVDAICINQHDNAEKAKQLPLMRDIYASATTVHVWLGEAALQLQASDIPLPADSDDQTQRIQGFGTTVEASTTRALSWLQKVVFDLHPLIGVRLAQFPQIMHPYELGKLIRYAYSRVLFKIAHRHVQIEPYASIHQDLMMILRRDWFKRAWTVQELVMAEEPLVICGAKALRWHYFFWGIVAALDQADETQTREIWQHFSPVANVYHLWIEMSKALMLRKSAHYRWSKNLGKYLMDCQMPCWLTALLFLFKPTAEHVEGRWHAFLQFMERYGRGLSYAQLFVVVPISVLWLVRKISLPNYYPLSLTVAITGWLCAATYLLTPPPTNTDWRQQLQETLLKILNVSRMQQATVLKDKTYSMYGLLQGLGVQLPEPILDPGYTLEAAYLEFTVSLLKWYRNLDILVEASGRWSKNAPSWVPDWSRPFKRVEGRQMRRHNTSTAPVEIKIVDGELRLFSGTQRLWSLSHNNTVLTVLGKEHGIIWAVLYLGETTETPTETTRNWFHSLIQDFHFPLSTIFTFILSISAFAVHSKESDITAYLTSLLNQTPPIDHSTRLEEHLITALREWLTIFVIRSSETYRLGAGPRTVQERDAVVELATLRSPSVLRRVPNDEGKYEFRGVCCVDANCSGSGWEGMGDGGEERWFDIV